MLFLIHVKAFHGKPRDLVIADYRYLYFRFSFQISDESCHLRFADHFLRDFRQVSIYKLNRIQMETHFAFSNEPFATPRYCSFSECLYNYLMT